MMDLAPMLALLTIGIVGAVFCVTAALESEGRLRLIFFVVASLLVAFCVAPIFLRFLLLTV